MANYKFACPTCSQRIAYDENAFGRKIRCPNCKSIITIPVPEGASPAVAPPPPPGAVPPPPPGVKPAGAVSPPPPGVKPAGPVAAAAPGGKSKKGLFIGIGVAVALVAGAGVTFMMRGGDDSGSVSPPSNDTAGAVDDANSSAAEPAENMAKAPEPDMDPNMAAAFGDMKPEPAQKKPAAAEVDMSWVPEDAQIFVSLRPAQLLESPLVKQLLSSQPQAKQALAGFEQMAGFKLTDVKSLLVAVSGLEELLDSDVAKNVQPGNPAAAQMAMMQAGQQLNDKQLVVLRLATELDLGANPMLAAQPEVEFEGKKYRRMQMAPNAPATAVFAPAPDTLIIGAEAQVKKAIATGGKARSVPAEIGALDPGHHLAFAFSPSAKSLAKIKATEKPDQLKVDPVAKLLSEHATGGALSLTSGAKGLALQALVGSDDAAAAEGIAVAMNEGIDQAPKQFEMLKSAIPENLMNPVADLIGSLGVLATDNTVEFSASVPNELLSEEGMGALMGFAMARAMQGGGQPPAMTASAPAVKEEPVTATPAPAAAAMKQEPAATAPAETAAAEPLPATAAQPATAPPPVEPEPAEPAPTSSGRVLRAWTMNILNAGIPEEPVFGEINNKEFKLDAALVENGVLILRDGSEKSPDFQVEVHNIQRPGEALDGKKFELPKVSGVATPAVRMKWTDPTKLRMPMRLYDNSFAIKLEFDNMKDGRISGRVFIAVPDGRKSFVAGSFDAEVF